MGEKNMGMPSPEEMAKMQGERALSDVELVKGGAKFNDRLELEPTEMQIEEARAEMVKDFYGKEKKAEEIERKIGEVADKFTYGYQREIVEDNEAPESYVWNGRRILRNTLQTIIRNLEETGAIRQKQGGFYSGKAGRMYELETSDASYEEFVDALNNIIKQYDKLFTGSERIYTEKYLKKPYKRY